ncbi:MAG: AAA family ATPase [Flavipsychrobacter sp.]|nr:AAA family ATPase [Flavipsychrobacter sp.]
MKIEINNLGPISHLVVDLKKDMHLIYGENSIGKSYATYTIYCLLKNIINKQYNRGYYLFHSKEDFESSAPIQFLRTKLKEVRAKKELDCTNEFISLLEDQLKDLFLTAFQNSLKNTFSSLKNLKNRRVNENYNIIIHLNKDEKINFISNDEGELDLKYESLDTKFRILEKSTKSTRFSFYINGKKKFGKPNEEQFINEFSGFFINSINKILRQIDFGIRDIYYLPASRSGLYQALNAFTPIIAKLTQSRFFLQSNSIELPSLSEPLSDYFIDLSTVDKKNENHEFKEIIELFQKDILKGFVDYNEDTKQIIFKPDDIDLELNLSESSSMVAELSPLVIYFRHILNNKYASNRIKDLNFFDRFYMAEYKQKGRYFDIIFIEEPEAHLHPKIQVALIEIFAKLTSLKLKIFITSHSNYMFNKLNNLILGNSLNEKRLSVYHLIPTGKGTIQSRDMKVTSEGIEDRNFQDVSEKLFNERIELFESKND